MSLQYDLYLQEQGLPPISHKRIETVTFDNPSEDFRKKLLKGGGIYTTEGKVRETTSIDDRSKSSGKSKSSSNTEKSKTKSRTDEPKISNTFTELFGQPIKKTSTKVSPDPKSSSYSTNSSNNKSSSQTQKSDGKPTSSYSSSKDNYKGSSSKDSKKIDENRRDEKIRNKPSSKERDRIVEKSKRPLSPSTKSRSPKRSSSPIKSSSSHRTDPTSTSDKNYSSSSSKKSKKDRKEKHYDRDRDRDRDRKETSRKDKEERSVTPNIKSTKSDYKQREQTAVKDSSKDKEKTKVNESNSKHFDTTDRTDNTKPSTTVALKKDLTESERPDEETDRRHKHKKKDKGRDKDPENSVKERKRDREKTSNKPKEEVNTSSSSTATKRSDTSPSGSIKPAKSSDILTSIMGQLNDEATSDSEPDSPLSFNDKPETFTENSNCSTSDIVPMRPEAKIEKSVAATVTTTKKRKVKEEKEEKKRKRKIVEEIQRPSACISPLAEAPGSVRSQHSDTLIQNSPNLQPSRNTSNGIDIDSENDDSDNESTEQLSSEYMNELRELQRKIMTLEDNNDMQQIVEVIAATGQYEVSSTTFDFDLCTLDTDIVRRLQEFFNRINSTEIR